MVCGVWLGVWATFCGGDRGFRVVGGGLIGFWQSVRCWGLVVLGRS